MYYGLQSQAVCKGEKEKASRVLVFLALCYLVYLGVKIPATISSTMPLPPWLHSLKM